MTIVSSSTSTLKTLMALYQNENKSSGDSSGTLTSDQISSIDNMLSGSSSSDASSSDTVDNLLGTSTTGSSDISAILDQIQAKQAAADKSSTTGSSDSSTAQTPQQEAASLMQSVYQSQQTNLFTLIG